MQSRDPTLGLSTLATHVGWLAPLRLVRVTLAGLAGGLWGPDASSQAALAIRWAFALTFAVVFLLLAVRTVRVARTWDGTAGNGPATGRWFEVQGATWAWGLLLFTLLAPVLLPWYLVWVLPVAWLLPAPGRIGVIVASTVLVASEVVAEPLAQNDTATYNAMVLVGHYVLTPILLVALVWLLADLVRRIGRGGPLEDARALRRTSPAPPDEGGRVPAQADASGDGERSHTSDRAPQRIHGQPGQDQHGGPGGGRDREPVHHSSRGPDGPAQPDRTEQEE
jgi:hypothetical protein